MGSLLLALCCLSHGELVWLFHEPHTGLDVCLRVLLLCFRKISLEGRQRGKGDHGEIWVLGFGCQKRRDALPLFIPAGYRGRLNIVMEMTILCSGIKCPTTIGGGRQMLHCGQRGEKPGQNGKRRSTTRLLTSATWAVLFVSVCVCVFSTSLTHLVVDLRSLFCQGFSTR